MLPPEPKEIKPHPYGVELGRLVAMLKDTEGADDRAVPGRSRSRASARAWPGGSARRPRSARGRTRKKIGRHEADALYQAIQQTKIPAPATDCICADRRGVDPQGAAPGGAGRVLRRRHAAAGRLSRQSVPDRSRPGLRRRARPPSASRARRWRELLGRERRPHAAAVPHHHVRRPGRRRGRQDPRRGRA